MAASLLGKMPITAERRFSSLFNRSMVWSQHTFALGGAGERDHVADFDMGRVHDHAVDQQLDQLAASFERRVLEAVGDRGAELLDARAHDAQLFLAGVLGGELLCLPPERV